LRAVRGRLPSPADRVNDPASQRALALTLTGREADGNGVLSVSDGGSNLAGDVSSDDGPPRRWC
jgi:hypothetical protein